MGGLYDTLLGDTCEWPNVVERLPVDAAQSINKTTMYSVNAIRMTRPLSTVLMLVALSLR